MKQLIIGAFLGFSLVLGVFYHSGENVTITVKDKERIVESNKKHTDSYYLVFTEGEVFRNSDNPLLWKFNSSDVQGQLEVGETYEVKVYGWRVPFLSMYRNIKKVN